MEREEMIETEENNAGPDQFKDINTNCLRVENKLQFEEAVQRILEEQQIKNFPGIFY
jgi:hypothetical protein